MQDFSLTAYKSYLQAIKKNYSNIYHFADFLHLPTQPKSFCLIRHDVDRKAHNALEIARIENNFGVVSTYYFRAKQHTFKPEIIREISALGHEVGYHYESLSDTDGDMEAALADFAENLSRFRELCEIKTISMHGRPLKSIDNRLLWRNPENYRKLKSEFNLLGEIYLEIDYQDIAYINDTGRNWTSNDSNIRDTVKSDVEVNHKNGQDLLRALQKKKYSKLVFQIHPERWEDNLPRWLIQQGFDCGTNFAKNILKLIGIY